MKNNNLSGAFRARMSNSLRTLDPLALVFTLLAVASAVTLLCLLGDGDTCMAVGAVITGAAGGSHVVGGPVTTDNAAEASPSLLRNEIDKRIVRIRPMSTPLDQISRWGGSRKAASMVVDYYAVDTKPTVAAVRTAVDADATYVSDGYEHAMVETDNNKLFEATETILVPSVSAADGEQLVLYVVSKDDNSLTVIPLNGQETAGVRKMPALAAKTLLVRMGRAASELDVQTAQFSAMPVKRSNFCQIFKAQVEQSTLMKMADKEAGWTFNDQEEVAVIDMRLGMEKNFLFGTRCRFTDSAKDETVFITGGVWNQAGRGFEYDPAAFDLRTMVSLTREAFTENAGSTRKILLAGSDLIERINNLDYNRVVMAGDKVTKWGIDFNEIHTKFGSLYVLHSEIFDQCGHSADGIVIDPEYIQKYSHIPFSAEKLDLKKSGLRNTDAVVLTEASCLVLRYPNAHLRVTAKTASKS